MARGTGTTAAKARTEPEFEGLDERDVIRKKVKGTVVLTTALIHYQKEVCLTPENLEAALRVLREEMLLCDIGLGRVFTAK